MATLLPEGKQSFTDSAGAPLVGGKLFTYDAGTSTPRPTYSDAAGTTPNTNPIVLDGRGEATIYWSGSYKATLTDASNAPIWTVDDIEFGATNLDVTAAAPGAVSRSLRDKLGDVLSVKDFGAKCDGVTDDTVAISAAVTEALARGMGLLWPDGVSVTSSSIPNFHAVSHYGEASLTRGADTFYISPTPTQTNRIYVNVTTGSNANDGLSSTQPLLTAQQAVTVLENYGPRLLGLWEVNFAAGTYTRMRFPDDGMPSEAPIVVQGPAVGGHPNVPTALFSEGSSVSAVGILANYHVDLVLKNIKFTGYNASGSSAGVGVNGFSSVTTDNCHFSNNYYGISSGSHTILDVKGGIIELCGELGGSGSGGTRGGAGIRGLFFVKFAVGSQGAGNLTNGPIIRENAFGVYAQEHCNGHIDWCDFQDNDHGVRLVAKTRLNLDGSSFKRCGGFACWANDGSLPAISANTTFGTGVDANSANFNIVGGSTSPIASILTAGTTPDARECCIARSAPNTAYTGGTGLNVVHTITVAAQLLRDVPTSVGVRKALRFRMYGSFTGTAGTKRLLARLGAVNTQITFDAADANDFWCEATLLLQEVGSQYMRIEGASHLGTVRSASAFPTEALTAATDFRLEVQLGNAADTITVHAYEVWVSGL